MHHWCSIDKIVIIGWYSFHKPVVFYQAGHHTRHWRQLQKTRLWFQSFSQIEADIFSIPWVTYLAITTLKVASDNAEVLSRHYIVTRHLLLHVITAYNFDKISTAFTKTAVAISTAHAVNFCIFNLFVTGHSYYIALIIDNQPNQCFRC